MGKKLRKALTVFLSLVMVAETLHVASMTVMASVSSGDALQIQTTENGSELEGRVDAAEKADQAAYEAAQAAVAAQAAAEALSEKSADAALTQEGDLKQDLENKVTDAEKKVTDANEEIEELQEKTDQELTGITEGAETDTAAKLQEAVLAAESAEAARVKAEEAAKAVANANDQFTAEQAAKEAQAAAAQAKAAADEAYNAYDDAVGILNAAIEAYNNAAAAAELDAENGDAVKAAQAALDVAQTALDNAKQTVDAAKAEYDAAMVNNATAQTAAAEAAKQAGIAEEAALDVTEKLEEKKNVDIDELTAKKAEAEQALAEAEAAKAEIEAQQDRVIAEAAAGKAAAEESIASNQNNPQFQDAKSLIADLTDKGSLGLKKSKLEKAMELAAKTPSEGVLGIGRITQEEIDAAKATVAAYEDAQRLVTEVREEIERQTLLAAEYQNKISLADEAKAAAALNLTQKQTTLAEVTATLATVTDYVYSDKNTEITYLDKTQQAAYQTLLSEMQSSFGAYAEVKADTEAYIEATKDEGFWKWLGGIFTGDTWKKWFDEMGLEAKYHGWVTESGTYIVVQNDKDNTQALITIRDDKAYIAGIDENEFATYSATFDAVAAAQAANKASEAANAEKAALDKYNAAVAALEAAQARLDAAKLNKLNIGQAAEALAAAKENVEAAKTEWEVAQAAADEAQEIAKEAAEAVETKPVTASYYVLNRGLTQPQEVTSYPTTNYSAAVLGELYSGVWDETTGTRDNSYIGLYKKGITGAQEVAQYLAAAPTAEQLALAGVVLKEDEYITWYVIKTEGDGYHVDGFINNQKFEIMVEYGYRNDFGKFTAFTHEDGSRMVQTVKVGLNESYEIVSPEVEGYIAGAEVVRGTATMDDILQVIYTKEPTQPVTINYYRGSLTGTLLSSAKINVEVSKLSDYAATIESNWLNSYRPGDCGEGVLAAYYQDEEENWIADIVYGILPANQEVIPGTPSGTTPGTDSFTPAANDTTEVTEGEEALLAGLTPATVNTVVNPGTPVQEEVNIEDEATPLANVLPQSTENKPEGEVAGVDREVVNLEEESVPLAAGAGNCFIHWLILLLTAGYTVYEIIRSIQRAQKIKKLEEQSRQAKA